MRCGKIASEEKKSFIGLRIPCTPRSSVASWKRLPKGRWKHGQAIPSEAALAGRFGVSVGTVRRAVGELAAENVLVRRQGSGTYVASHTRDYMLSVFFWIVDVKDRKELPRAEVLSYRRGRADARTAERLHLRPGAPSSGCVRCSTSAGVR